MQQAFHNLQLENERLRRDLFQMHRESGDIIRNQTDHIRILRNNDKVDNEKISQLVEEKSKLEHEMSSLRKKDEDLERKVEKLEKENQEKEQKRYRLLGRNQKLQQELQTEIEKNRGLEERLNSGGALNLNSEASNMGSLTMKLFEKDCELKKYQESSNNLVRELTMLKEQMNQLDGRIIPHQLLETEKLRIMGKCNEEMEKLKKENMEQKKKIENQTRQLNDIQNRQRQINQLWDEDKTTISELRKKIGNLEHENNRMENQNYRLLGQKSRADERISEEVRKNKELMKSFELERKKLKEDYERDIKELESLQKPLQMNCSNSPAGGLNADLYHSITYQMDYIESLKAKIDSIISEKEQSNTKQREMSVKLSETQNELKKCEEQKNLLASELECLKAGNKRDLEDTTCLICTTDMEQVHSLPKCETCKRRYHHECISQWFQTKPECPVCRSGANQMENMNR